MPANLGIIRGMSTDNPHPNLFDYSDFRLYLRDWYASERAKGKIRSQAELCRKLGLPNTRSYFKDILNGKLLSTSKLKLFIRLLGFDEGQARFFRTLVDYNQTVGDPEEREWLLEQLIALNQTPKKIISHDELEYYTHWYHGIIRTILGIVPFKGDHRALGKMLVPPITARQVKDSIQLLKKLKLIERKEGGFLKPTHNVITSGSFAKDEIIKQYQLKQLDNARRAVTAASGPSRRIITKTMGISEEAYEAIQKKLEKFNSEITAIVHKDQKPADRVYHLGMVLVPQSKPYKNRKKYDDKM